MTRVPSRGMTISSFAEGPTAGVKSALLFFSFFSSAAFVTGGFGVSTSCLGGAYPHVIILLSHVLSNTVLYEQYSSLVHDNIVDLFCSEVETHLS